MTQGMLLSRCWMQLFLHCCKKHVHDKHARSMSEKVVGNKSVTSICLKLGMGDNDETVGFAKSSEVLLPN